MINIYTKNAYFADIQYIYNAILTRNIIMNILRSCFDLIQEKYYSHH